MITWEFAKDRYGVTEFWLEILSTINPPEMQRARKIKRGY